METISSHIDSMRIELTGLNVFVFVFLAAAAVFTAIMFYRSTVPPVTGWKRMVPTILRGAALLILVFTLAEPAVTVLTTLVKRSVTAVLLDTSSSMDQAGDPGRKTGALAVFEAARARFGKGGFFAYFDNHFRTVVNGNPAFDGTGTDILDALTRAAALPGVSSVILISDGRWNLGGDPAGPVLPVDIPIHTVIVGSKETLNDVMIASVSAARVGREGEPLPVELTISSSGTPPVSVPVELIENGRAVASKTLLFGGGNSSRVSFDIIPGAPGDYVYTAVIKPAVDEYPDNNTRSFRVHVLKSSFRILLAADKPSTDFAFLRRVLGAGKPFELVAAVNQGTAGELARPVPDDFSGFDAIILIDWGGSLDRRTMGRIAERCAGGAGLWLLGSSPPGPGAEVLLSVLPVNISAAGRVPAGQCTLELTVAGKTHFVTAFDTGFVDMWNSLPPLADILPVTSAKDAAVLALAKFKDGIALPALISGRHGAGKVLVIPLSGTWQWRLMMEGAGKDGSFYERFVTSTANWLTAGPETSPLNITTDRTAYLAGQDITFEARLYDTIFVPVSGADITLTVDDDPSTKIKLRETQPAVYTGTVRGPGAGPHRYSAEAYLNSMQYAMNTGAFTVEDFPLERLDPSPDTAVMGAIAAKTGGISVTPAGIDSVFSRIEPETLRERSENTYHLYLNPLIPFAVILLLVIEWSLRKYFGMI